MVVGVAAAAGRRFRGPGASARLRRQGGETRAAGGISIEAAAEVATAGAIAAIGGVVTVVEVVVLMVPMLWW